MIGGHSPGRSLVGPTRSYFSKIAPALWSGPEQIGSGPWIPDVSNSGHFGLFCTVFQIIIRRIFIKMVLTKGKNTAGKKCSQCDIKR